MKRKLRKGMLVKVTWNDAHLKLFTEDHNPLVMEDVGWVTRANKKGISLTGTKPLRNSYGNRAYTFIPSGCIKSVKVFEK